MQQKREVKVLLAESFKELVMQKPVEKITIKEITDRAGVIRVTFYNHFQDKYELLEWICREEIVSPTKILFQNNMRREAVTFIFTAILKNKEFYSHVAHTQGQNSFSSTVRQLVSETIEEHFLANKSGKHEKYSLLTAKWIADYYAMSLTYILMSWIDRDMDIPPEDMVNIYEYVAQHSLISLPETVGKLPDRNNSK
jgi:probable dihydroxyacetone kinase regulator